MDDDTLRDEGEPAPVEVADDEFLDSDDISPLVDDDTVDDDTPDEKTVPYTRFKDVNDKLKDIETKYAAATTPKKEVEPSPKKQYSQEQVETVKELAGTKELHERLEENERRWEEQEKKTIKSADEQDRKITVKDKDLNPNGFKEDQVQKQVQKWAESKDPDKQWLAAASYPRIIKEMNENYSQNKAKKSATPPEVSKSAASESTVRNPDIKDSPTNVTNPLKYRRSLSNEAVEFMKSLDGGANE